ncbi:hypothetical protein Sango_1243600 [Sesamum angolense]|uniref:Uncharacterized protein n=1 Tax=Sesamum angolense TaxID=2727404 RepID=A0AAE1WQM2_9LAMI|nr:hypothetical protein Sango_1243600 [Sesamum angolense]
MGQQNDDPRVVGSSIVLLQERFKQLQRLKEMREERQLRKPLPQSTGGYHEAAKLRMSFSTSGAAFHDPLALGLNSINAHDHASRFRTTNPQGFPSSAAAAAAAAAGGNGTGSFFGNVDVDTSLHL